MGKASKLKQIRRIASGMPALSKRVMVGVRVDGAELIKNDIKQVQGKDVVASNQYRSKHHIEVPLNHNRQMKKAYYKFGAQGVNGYIHAVNNFVASQPIKP